MKKENYSEIMPFGQTKRVGNHKLWRSKAKIKTANGPMEIDCINISVLSGEWYVRIPETYEMYGVLMDLYGRYISDDKDEHDAADNALHVMFNNMMFASVIGNGYYHHALDMIAMVYANPSLLGKEDKVHDEFMRDVEDTIREFLKWRSGYDEEVKKHEPTEEDLHHDDVADQASEILDS